MKKIMIALGLTVSMLIAGTALAADQTRTQSRKQAKTAYQAGTQERSRTQDQVKSQTKSKTQTQDRLRDGSCTTAK